MKLTPFNSHNYRARSKLTDSIFSLEGAEDKENVSLKVGYLSVSTLTASAALPVKDVLVTVYTINEEGEEKEIVRHVSDANGNIPLITLPVIYNPLDPFESSEFFFTTYNLRAQAINYYTVNIIDLRIFPDVTTYFTIEMIPLPIGPSIRPETTIVIPPNPVDMSND